MAKTKYTFLLYMNVFPDLDAKFIDTFESISKTYSAVGGVDIYILADRSSNTVRDPNAIQPVTFQWNETVIFKIKEGIQPEKINASKIYPVDLDLGQQNALQGFIEYVYQDSDSECYFLSIWSHGAILVGAADGAFSKSFPLNFKDNELIKEWHSPTIGATNLFNQFISQTVYHFQPDFQIKRQIERERLLPDIDNQALIMNTISAAILAANKSKNKRISIIGLDACCLGMLENLYELDGCADYIVACENFISSSGLNYSGYLAYIYANPDHTLSEFLSEVVQRYLENALTDDMISVVSMQEFNDFKGVVQPILAYVNTHEVQLKSILDGNVQWANYFISTGESCKRENGYDWPVVDLNFFLSNINQKYQNAEFSNLYNSFEHVFSKLVFLSKSNITVCFNATSFGNFGLGFYFPNNRESTKQDYLDILKTHYPNFSKELPEWMNFIERKSN